MPYRYAVIALVLVLALSFLWGCEKRPSAPEIPEVAAEDRVYAIAEVFFKTGDYDNAMLQYQAYVSQYPQRPPAADALMKMASIHVIRGQYESARKLYRRVFDDYPDSASAVNARVEILATYYHQGDYAGFFERVAALDPAALSSSALLRLYKLTGDAHLASGQAKAAVDAYAKSLSYSGARREAVTPEMATAIGVLDVEEIEELLDGPEYLPKAYLLYQLGKSSMIGGWDQTAMDAFGAFLLSYPDHELAGEVEGFLAELEQKAAYDRYTVGCLLPLTGPYSSYGNRALNGIELALDRFRLNHPEVPIKLVVKDTASSEPETIQAVRELDAERVAAILGPIVMAKQAAEEAQRIGIPIISLSQKEGIADIGDFVFRNFLTPGTQVETMVSYLTRELGITRFAILYPDEKYGSTFMNFFWDQVIAHGGIVTGCESYQGESTDFADSIKKLVGLHYELPEYLKTELMEAARPFPEELWEMMHPRVFQDGFATRSLAWQPLPDAEGRLFSGINIFMLGDASEELLTGEGDYPTDKASESEAIVDFEALFIPDSPKKTGLIVPQLAYYDVDDVHLVGTNLWHSDELIQMARRYLQNSLLTDGFFAESSLPLVREFVDSFQSIFGAQPGFVEAVSYDTADILFDTVSRPEVGFRSAIRDHLASGLTFQGVTGATSFLETGEAEKELFLLQFRGGGFRAGARPMGE
jgi:ABC-type branched-subunit amino acid transport system substrate-binding protein